MHAERYIYMRFRNCFEKITKDADRGRNNILVGEESIPRQIRPAQHVPLHPLRLRWWHYSNRSSNRYV